MRSLSGLVLNHQPFNLSHSSSKDYHWDRDVENLLRENVQSLYFIVYIVLETFAIFYKYFHEVSFITNEKKDTY
jgi:hypothetical protein